MEMKQEKKKKRKKIPVFRKKPEGKTQLWQRAVMKI